MPNRLASATSPYLLQHADNPVDWWEWGPEAFEEARRRGVPVLLSVGYAACHWCHVMAHESFEDEATAAYMDEHFVSIKVDREERPDVDAIYMQATVAMTGRGGWPMTVVLDHDASPWFAGTYFPDTPRHGQASFASSWRRSPRRGAGGPTGVRRQAAQLREHLQAPAALPSSPSAPATSTPLSRPSPPVRSGRRGFGGAPKFPPLMLEFLLRHGSDDALRMVDHTLDGMIRGGIHDQLAGGFARYSVDGGWVVPHFEKMLYDNALLLRVCADRRTAPALWAGEQAAEFLLRELRTAEGGFASALDADSEGKEGLFYSWTPAQLVEALGEDDGAWAAELSRSRPTAPSSTGRPCSSCAATPTRRPVARRAREAVGGQVCARAPGGRRQGGGRLDGLRSADWRASACGGGATTRRRGDCGGRAAAGPAPGGRAAAPRVPRRQGRRSCGRVGGLRVRHLTWLDLVQPRVTCAG